MSDCLLWFCNTGVSICLFAGAKGVSMFLLWRGVTGVSICYLLELTGTGMSINCYLVLYGIGTSKVLYFLIPDDGGGGGGAGLFS